MQGKGSVKKTLKVIFPASSPTGQEPQRGEVHVDPGGGVWIPYLPYTVDSRVAAKDAKIG